MKIVFVDTTMHDTLIGGAQLFLPGLMNGLRSKGHDIHLVTNGLPNAKVADFINESGISLHIKPWKKNGIIQDVAPLFAAWINELAPDIYVISVSADIGWVALPILNPNIATLTIGHNDEETFYMPARHYQPYITRVVGVSHEINTHYNELCNVVKEQIDWIPYGVPTRKSLQHNDDTATLRLAYVGRVVEEQKRASDLIYIAKILGEKNIDFRLTIVGDGESMTLIKESLQEEINAEKVIIRGWLKGAETIDVLRETDIFILTSAYEGFCIALIEAMANGCCPIVTNIKSGNKELVKDSVSGFIVEIGDVVAFAEKIEILYKDKQKLRQMRQAAWEEGSRYSIERMVTAYEDSFKQAMADTKKNVRAKSKNYPLMKTCMSKYPDWIRRFKYMVTPNN